MVDYRALLLAEYSAYRALRIRKAEVFLDEIQRRGATVTQVNHVVVLDTVEEQEAYDIARAERLAVWFAAGRPLDGDANGDEL